MIVYSVISIMILFIGLIINGALSSLIPLVTAFAKKKDVKSIKFAIKEGYKYLFIIVLIIFVFLEIFPGALTSFFNLTNPTDISNCILGIRITVFCIIVSIFTKLFYSYYQALQRIKFSAYITTSRSLLIIPLAYVLVSFYGLLGMWFAYILVEVITAIFIIVFAKYLEKKSKGKYKGVYLLEQLDDNVSVFDVTIKSNIDSAVDLSEALINFSKSTGLSNKTSNIIGLATEESIINIIQLNKETINIDVLCKIFPDEVLINFRDNGVPVNLTKIQDDENVSTISIDILKHMATDISYTQTMGLNNLTILLKENIPDFNTILNITCTSTLEDSVNLSQNLIDFTREQELSEKLCNKIGLASEEILMDIHNSYKNPVNINTICRIHEKEVIIHINYDGALKNILTENVTSDNINNVDILQNLATKLEYSEINGLNNINILLKR